MHFTLFSRHPLLSPEQTKTYGQIRWKKSHIRCLKHGGDSPCDARALESSCSTASLCTPATATRTRSSAPPRPSMPNPSTRQASGIPLHYLTTTITTPLHRDVEPFDCAALGRPPSTTTTHSPPLRLTMLIHPRGSPSSLLYFETKGSPVCNKLLSPCTGEERKGFNVGGWGIASEKKAGKIIITTPIAYDKPHCVSCHRVLSLASSGSGLPAWG